MRLPFKLPSAAAIFGYLVLAGVVLWFNHVSFALIDLERQNSEVLGRLDSFSAGAYDRHAETHRLLHLILRAPPFSRPATSP